MKNKPGANENNTSRKKHGKTWIKRVNAVLSVILILGILLTSFGGYTLAQSLNSSVPHNDKTTEDDPNPDDTEGDKAAVSTKIPGGEGLGNEMTLKNDVKVFAEKEAEKINSAVTSIEVIESSFENGDKLEIKFDKTKKELFGKLEYGDVFVLEGDKNTPFGETYIMKVSNVYETEGTTVLRTVQPYFDEVFDEIAVNIDEAVKKENLVKSASVPGVSMHFGDIDKEFANSVSANSVNAETPYSISDSMTAQSTTTASSVGQTSMNVTNLATQYETPANDFIVELDFDLKKSDSEEEEDKNDKSDFEGKADVDFKLKGSIGIKDLSAYMICDMPKPLQFKELFIGAKGQFYKKIELSVDLSASAKGKATEVSTEFLGASAKASGLNEKLIPLGIWQFAGTTPIKISTATYKNLRVAPSYFLMLYSDWEGNISFEFTASFEHKSSFSGGLRLIKDGKPAMNMENYPYNIGNGEEDEDGSVWSVQLELDANTELTLLGGSVLFCIGGINIGEISLLRLGMEAQCDIKLSASSDKGIETPNLQNSTYYLRMFFKSGEINVRFSANVNIFSHDWGFSAEFEFCLIDITLFEIGNKPDKYKPKSPVSTKPYPDSFDSIITLVCDVSGSMDDRTGTGETKLEAAKAAGKVISAMVRDWSTKYPGDYGMGVVQFSNNAKTLAYPHIDYPFINECIEAMSDGGGTNIASGLEFGISQFDSVEVKSKVIILMTDGRDGYGSNITEQAEIAKNKNIRIFTIGFGNDVDESMLKQVAEKTGGEYRFAGTDNIVGIIGSFMYAQQSAEADVLTDEQGTVAQGETTEAKTFTVPDKSGNLNAVLYWPGSILDLILQDPNGRRIDEDYPGAVIDNSSIPATVVIENPLPGKWKMKVKGVETSYENEPYYAITSFKKINREELNTTPELETFELIGAYSLPIGFFTVLMSTMLLVFVNYKKKQKADD